MTSDSLFSESPGRSGKYGTKPITPLRNDSSFYILLYTFRGDADAIPPIARAAILVGIPRAPAPSHSAHFDQAAAFLVYMC